MKQKELKKRGDKLTLDRVAAIMESIPCFGWLRELRSFDGYVAAVKILLLINYGVCVCWFPLTQMNIWNNNETGKLNKDEAGSGYAALLPYFCGIRLQQPLKEPRQVIR